ncbi:uncharacterized protein LOC106181094 [Lingula anatina]|uniref:Uncharacterized protein LOC106181094 n=1 Tax=Lingula anatina TaxID=7574 RepID=A0A1S3KED9_LINAN|nr:uncharacterized protein LOC106181094 [Lingula anatina]|eukprot:XP_013420824.1 uncharacterized protein LOC106181094 [Lingula anatina]
MVPGGLLLFCASLLVAAPSICQGACSINSYCSDCANYTEEGHTKWRFYCNPYSGYYIDPSHFTVTNDTVELFQVKYFSSSSKLSIYSGAFRYIPNIVHADIRNTRSTNPSISSRAFYYGVQNSLRALLFRSSYLTTVPSALTHLTALQELDLGGNRITGDPYNYLSYLTSLQSLWLDNNRLLSSVPASLERLPNLRKLSLASCYLNRSSLTSFRQLPRSLEWLNVYNNYQLAEVPSGIGLLRNLTYLNMRYCNLNSLPVNVFANLNKLEVLDLSQNPSITSYLDALANQKSLKVLSLSNMGSSLTDIPSAISGMEKMEELDLNNNRIRGVNHNHFAKMVQLRKLNLANNKITSLDPLSFQYCVQLEELEFSYNLIQEVNPIHFVAQVRLRKINLSYNRIHSLGPRLFQNCKNLKYVDFSNNLITKMDQNVFIGPSQSLRYVDLRNNKCDTFHKCIVAKLEQFQTFYFSTAFFNCDCRLAWVRQITNQYGSRVSVSGACYRPRELYSEPVSSYPLNGCTPDDESFESCNIASTTNNPDTEMEPTPTSKALYHSLVNSAQKSSLNKDLRSVQTITTVSVSVAVIAIVAFLATLVVLLTCFFRQRNQVSRRSQDHVNQGLQLSEGVQGERSPEGQCSGENLYQNTDGMVSSAPSGAYEPLRKDGQGLTQHRGHYASSPVVHKHWTQKSSLKTSTGSDPFAPANIALPAPPIVDRDSARLTVNTGNRMVPGGLFLFCASLLVATPSICQGACSINSYCSDCTNFTEEGQTKWRFYCDPYSGYYIYPSHFTVTNDTVELFQVKQFSSSSTPTIRSGAFRNIPNTLRVDIRNTRSTSPSVHSLAFYYGVQNSLQTLLFRSSYLNAVPSALEYLTSLQELDLGGNRISGDPSNYLSYLTSLQSLTLDNNRLYSSIPASLEHLPNLQKLSVASCYLNRSSVTSFGKLPRSLEWLNLYNNYQLYEVPSGIGLLRNLTYLNMRYCNLNSLPVNVFANLNKLEILDLSQNPSITSYLDVLVNQKSLKVLRLSYMGSSLTDIPNAISDMEKMEELDLKNNRIRGVNQIHFAKMVQLRKLNLANNKITSLDPLSFHYCDQLEELDLSNNLIQEVNPIHFVTQTEPTPASKTLNSAQLSSLQKDLSNVQTITTVSVSVAVAALLAFVATIAMLLTCFFKRRNRVPSNGRSQGHVNQGLQLSEGVQSERSPECQSSGDNLYQNTDGMASSAPSGAYEPLRKDGRGLTQHRGHYASSPVVHK